MRHQPGQHQRKTAALARTENADPVRIHERLSRKPLHRPPDSEQRGTHQAAFRRLRAPVNIQPLPVERLVAPFIFRTILGRLIREHIAVQHREALVCRFRIRPGSRPRPRHRHQRRKRPRPGRTRQEAVDPPAADRREADPAHLAPTVAQRPDPFPANIRRHCRNLRQPAAPEFVELFGFRQCRTNILMAEYRRLLPPVTPRERLRHHTELHQKPHSVPGSGDWVSPSNAFL